MLNNLFGIFYNSKEKLEQPPIPPPQLPPPIPLSQLQQPISSQLPPPIPLPQLQQPISSQLPPPIPLPQQPISPPISNVNNIPSGVEDEMRNNYLNLVGNIATTGVIKAKDFIREDGKKLGLPDNFKVNENKIEVVGDFTANGEFIVKSGNDVVYNVNKDGNTTVKGNIKVNKSMIGNDPNGFVELRGGTPYIDFTHNETVGDFDNRIILENRELNVTGNMNIRGSVSSPNANLNGVNNAIPLHVQSAEDAHIRLTGRNNENNSSYLINRNGGNFMVHHHGVGDVFQVHRNGRVHIHNTTGHPINANDYSMEIYTPQQDGIKETSLRFHQGNRYWHQIRADNSGFRMSNGSNGNLSNLEVNTLNANSSNIKGDLVFNGGNNWIIHTPDDNRHSFYIAPSKAVNNTEWNWANEFRIDPNGSVIAKNLVIKDGLSMMNDTRNENNFPSFYRNKAKLIGKGAKFTEFKYNENINIKKAFPSLEGYSYVETIVPWPDTTGGRVKQIAYTDSGIKYRVGSPDDNNWEPWV